MSQTASTLSSFSSLGGGGSFRFFPFHISARLDCCGGAGLAFLGISKNFPASSEQGIQNVEDGQEHTECLLSAHEPIRDATDLARNEHARDVTGHKVTLLTCFYPAFAGHCAVSDGGLAHRCSPRPKETSPTWPSRFTHICCPFCKLLTLLQIEKAYQKQHLFQNAKSRGMRAYSISRTQVRLMYVLLVTKRRQVNEGQAMVQGRWAWF